MKTPTKAPPTAATLQLADGHTIKVTLETVTPAIAAQWLELNIRNRKPRPRQVEILRREMAGGAWQFTHQGIAFGQPDADGITPLIDGQHRLQGVVASGATLTDMLVFRNLPTKAQEATDMGQARSVAENLALFDKEINVNSLCTLVNATAQCWARYDTKVSLPQTREILRIFPRLRLLAKVQTNKYPAPFTMSPVRAVCGIAIHQWKEAAAIFHDAYQEGLGLTAEHPAHHLRNYCLRIETNNLKTRQQLFNYSADCLQQFIECKPMTSPAATGTGSAWLRTSLGSKYTQLRTILRLV